MTQLPQTLSELQKLKEHVQLQELKLIEKGLSSEDPAVIMEAAKSAKDISQRGESNMRSLLIDPSENNMGMGWKEKYTQVSFETLGRMARVPVISAIIGTRVEQVAAFTNPQKDKYSPGFVIKKKDHAYFGTTSGIHSKGLTSREKDEIRILMDAVLNCGEYRSQWFGDDFDSFTRKVINDSLTYDQMTWEIVRNRKGVPVQWVATDASTYRVADTWNAKRGDSIVEGRQGIYGYYPSYVQVIEGMIHTEFYPWELCFGIRNPSTSAAAPYYGKSELEDLIYIVTAILWADQYNMNNFRLGAFPKGILKVAGNVSNNELSAFRQQFNQMIQGVQNAGRTMVVEADKMDWVDLTKATKDMEYAKFQEYLLKVCCAIYKIDAAEVGFSLNGGSETRIVFESNNEAKLTHSKDKGLRPLLKFYESRYNRYVISPISSEYELKFVGIDSKTEKEELDDAVKKLSNFMTVNEIRKAQGLNEIKDGDYINSSSYFQMQGLKQQQVQQEQMQRQMGGGEEQEQVNPFE